MTIYIYNSLSRTKQLLIPIEDNTIKMYVCGMTVYDYCHIGHARVMVVFDIIKKWLVINNFNVIYVRNITDIDDKIIERAVKNKQTITELTTQFIQAMHEDADALGIERPNIEPRATEYIQPMLSMIGKLIENNLAYQAKNKDINFSVRSFPNYGKLSGKNIQDLESGHRELHQNNNSTQKDDQLDFVLWKSAKENEPEEVKWQSPWGLGRPGWHIECSAMSCNILGQQFDIHGGGADLQFPHHENEIAQSEGAYHIKDGKHNGKNLANYWIHNGFVQVNDEKMSKSLGNFFTIRDVFKHFHPEVVRFFILKAHYRSPLNYSASFLQEAKNGLERLYNVINKLDEKNHIKLNLCKEDDWHINIYSKQFYIAMNDDFNTAMAISVLFDLASKINKQLNINTDIAINIKQDEEIIYHISLLKYLAHTLGICKLNNAHELNINFKHATNINEDFILQQINLRTIAKNNKQFDEADAIRKQLKDLGIILQDAPNGETKWSKI